MLLASLFASPLPAQINLPDLGNSAATQMTLEQENEQGLSFYLQLKHDGYIIEDPVINSYITQLGENLLSSAETGDRKFTFFVVNNPQINAFAMLGGYIGINTGLILASETESELASVIAHEITHVTQQHLLRIMEKMGNQSAPAAAAILAAILLGKSDPMAAEAAVYSVIANQYQSMISYTRMHEHEADRIGIEMLASAGYDPNGMVDFFSKLEQTHRYGDNSLPEYLRTHPVTTTRISEAKDRAQLFSKNSVKHNLNFDLAKAKIDVLTLLENKAFIHYWETELQQNKRLTTGNLYALALAYIADGAYKKALPLCSQLITNHPQNIPIIETHAHLLHLMGNSEEAQKRLKKALLLYPNNPALTIELAKQLLDDSQFDEARQYLNGFTEKRAIPEGYQLLSKVESRAGNRGYAHFYLAQYHLLYREYPLVMTQLRYARENAGQDFYLSSRINDLMNTIKPHIDKLSKKERRYPQ